MPPLKTGNIGNNPPCSFLVMPCLDLSPISLGDTWRIPIYFFITFCKPCTNSRL